MTFKYSICDPAEKEIKYIHQIFTSTQVLNIAKKYPWTEKLNIMDSLDPDEVQFNPSLDFNCIETKRSFGLTAHFSKDKNLAFSLWYNRPKIVKIFFGLFGESEKMIVDDVWSFSLEDSLNYLDHFVNGNYQIVEDLYQ